jgi:hypothetical protein
MGVSMALVGRTEPLLASLGGFLAMLTVPLLPLGVLLRLGVLMEAADRLATIIAWHVMVPATVLKGTCVARLIGVGPSFQNVLTRQTRGVDNKERILFVIHLCPISAPEPVPRVPVKPLRVSGYAIENPSPFGKGDVKDGPIHLAKNPAWGGHFPAQQC